MIQWIIATESFLGSTFCLRHAAHALTFLEIPGSLLSAAAPSAEFDRCGLGGALAITGGSPSTDVRCFFVGDVACAGEGKALGDVEEIILCRFAAPCVERGEASSASDQLRLDILRR